MPSSPEETAAAGVPPTGYSGSHFASTAPTGPGAPQDWAASHLFITNYFNVICRIIIVGQKTDLPGAPEAGAS